MSIPETGIDRKRLAEFDREIKALKEDLATVRFKSLKEAMKQFNAARNHEPTPVSTGPALKQLSNQLTQRLESLEHERLACLVSRVITPSSQRPKSREARDAHREMMQAKFRAAGLARRSSAES